MTANYGPVNPSARLHLRTASKSLPAVVDIDSDSSAASSPSSSDRYPLDTVEQSSFRSWQYPSSPELSDDDRRAKRDDRQRPSPMERINEHESSPESPCNKTRSSGYHQASRASISRRHPSVSFKGQRSQANHRPTASMPYGYQIASSNAVNAVAGGVKRGPAALLPYLFANLRRARYNDLFFGLIFLGCLGMFLSALGGVGYSPAPYIMPSALPAGVIAGLQETAKGVAPDLARQIIPAPLQITPISPHGEKDDIPLFADVIPHKRRPTTKKSALLYPAPQPPTDDQIIVDFSHLEADSAVGRLGGKPYVEPHDEGKPDLVANSPDDPRLDDEHADHEHHESPENIFGHGHAPVDGADDEDHSHGEHHPAPLPFGVAPQQLELNEDTETDMETKRIEEGTFDRDASELYHTEARYQDDNEEVPPFEFAADEDDEYANGLPGVDMDPDMVTESGYQTEFDETTELESQSERWNPDDDDAVKAREVEELTGRQKLRVRRLR